MLLCREGMWPSPSAWTRAALPDGSSWRHAAISSLKCNRPKICPQRSTVTVASRQIVDIPLASAQKVPEWRNHTARVQSLAFTPSGAFSPALASRHAAAASAAMQWCPGRNVVPTGAPTSLVFAFLSPSQAPDGTVHNAASSKDHCEDDWRGRPRALGARYSQPRLGVTTTHMQVVRQAWLPKRTSSPQAGPVAVERYTT